MIRHRFLTRAAVVALLAQTGLLRAEEAPPAKNGYSLFDPVPDNLLRELSTDRPGKSHSSKTVDAGHFQIESDFITYAWDPGRGGHPTTRNYSIATPILKVGATNSVDIEIATSLFNHLRQSDGAATLTARGFGDTSVGAKINLFGNDGGDRSLALMPFVKLPTAEQGIGNGYAEFTLNVPYTMELTKPWSLTLEPNFGVLRNSSNTAYRQNYGFIANLNRPVFFDKLTAAIEIAVDFSSEGRSETKVSIDPSIQWLVTPNLQLDAGIYIGLNKATPKYIAYTGVSYRF